MNEKINIAPLIYDLVLTIIAVAGIYYDTTFNVVAVLVLIIGSVKGCYSELSKDSEFNTKKILIILNVLMLVLTSFMLFITIGIYNGKTNLLTALRYLSLSCAVKIGIDITYTIWYNYITK